ncbi:hypothetical protein ACOMHN_055625 [Nucella lapillus]
MVCPVQVTTSNWLPGQPRNWTGGLSCAQVVGAPHGADTTAAWRSSDCSQRAAFICQTPASEGLSCYQVRACLVTSPLVVAVRGGVGAVPLTACPFTLSVPWSWRCGEGWVLSPSLPVHPLFQSPGRGGAGRGGCCSPHCLSIHSFSPLVVAVRGGVGAVPLTACPSTLSVPWSWRCGEGWVLSPSLSSCFLLVTQVTVPWASARAQCRRHGGDLVSISSYRHQTVLEALVRSAGLASGEGAWSGLWMGATDNSREGGWEWTDSAPFRYLNWAPGQPDDRGWGGEEQDCAVVMPADTLRWDDRDCDELHNYICMKTGQ